MRLDITEVLNGRAAVLPFSYTFSPENMDAAPGCAAGDAMLPDDVRIPENGIAVTGEIRSAGRLLTFTAHVDAAYETCCARCLEPITAQVSFDITRTVHLHQSRAGASHVDDDGEWDGVLDDVLVVSDACILPDADILEQLALELPFYSLCQPDCAGLCPHCGKKRSLGCRCAEEEAEKRKKDIDPRLAKLQKLLDNQK